MVRIALLATVLAALCYTTRAIPVQVGNTEVQLPKDIVNKLQQIRDQIPKEVEDLTNKITERFKKEFQEKKKIAEDIFENAKENAKKMLQENINVNQVFDYLKKVKQEIETKYQYDLSNRIQDVKDTFGNLSKKELTLKLREKLDSLKDKAKGMLGKKQSADVAVYGASGNIVEKGKDIWNGIRDKFTEKSNKIVDGAAKKFEENLNEILENEKMKELKDYLDKSLNKLKEVAKNIKGKAKEGETGKIKRSVSQISEDRQYQQAGLLTDWIDASRNIFQQGADGMKNSLDSTKKAIDNIKDLLDTGLGTEKKETKDEPKSN